MSRLVKLGAAALSLFASVDAAYINYTSVTGYFLQDESSTKASTFDYVSRIRPLCNSYVLICL